MPRTMSHPAGKNTPRSSTSALVETIIDNIRQRILTGGEQLVSASLGSLINVVAILIYAIPGAPDGLLHAQGQTGADGRPAPLPAPQPHPGQPGLGEMNDQIINHIRGKVIEIVIVGIATCALRPDGIALLRPAGGRGRLLRAHPPHRCRRGDRAGGHGGPVPVGLTPDFAWLMVAYFVIQAPRRQPAGPLLFSEAVQPAPGGHHHRRVLVFGGLWGFGVFAIPLATLVKRCSTPGPSGRSPRPAPRPGKGEAGLAPSRYRPPAAPP